MQPLVSILVLTYNHEEFIVEAIESALNQTYSNFEIVISDDCSTDNTIDILTNFQLKYPEKIKVINSNLNLGVTVNHNRALVNSIGEYVCFMGGDDILLPDKVSQQVDFMLNVPDCEISYHNLEVFDSYSNKFLYYFNDKNTPRNGNVLMSIMFGTFNGACGTMVKRKKELLFDERISLASDWYFWIENLAKGGKILFIDKVLSRYRKHNSSVSSTTSSNKAFYERVQTLYYASFKYPYLAIFCLISLIRFGVIELALRVKFFLIVK
jgi:glycosyltransferase involved in cell wall biosynthesis